MQRTFRIVILVCLILASGCTELRQTNRLLNMALVELFRLPIYCIRLPFQILTNLGPVIQASVRTAANVAPLLLLIEKRTEKDFMYAEGKGSYPLETAIERELANNAPVPLLRLLDDETAQGTAKRFILVDARLMRNVRLRDSLFKSLGAGRDAVRCVLVDGSGIFLQSNRFLSICRRMGTRGDSLLALTAFNERLSELTGTPCGTAPPDIEGRHIFLRWHRQMNKMEEEAYRRG